MRRWLRWWLGIDAVEDRISTIEKRPTEADLIANLSKKQDELNQMFQQLRDMKSELQANSRQVIKTRGWREFAAQMERD